MPSFEVPCSRFLALGLVVAAGLSGCGNSPARAAEPKQERPFPVSVTSQREGAVTEVVRAAGLLHAKREADLSFKVPGVVQRVLVEEGAHVRRGQLLALLDPTELQAGSAQASESYTKAERDLARVRLLHDGKSVPRNMLDDAETALAVARASAVSADFNLRHAALNAPEDGVIDRRMIELGEVVAPARPVLHFKSSAGSVVHVGLVDRDALALSLGDRAEVVLDARPDQPFAARVTRVASSVTPGLGTFEVELSLLDPRVALRLPSGLTCKVSFARTLNARSLPVTALVDGDGDRASVYVVEAGRARRVPVELERIAGERALLRKGVAQGARVVATGSAELRDGALLRIVGEE